MKRIYLLFMACAAFFVILSCGDVSPEPPPPPPEAPELTVSVLDSDANPIEGAFVQIGVATLPGTTDADGIVVFKDNSLNEPQPVTAAKAGFRNYTIEGIKGAEDREIIVVLSPLEPPHGYIKVSVPEDSWPPLADDMHNGRLRFGLVFPIQDDMDTVYDITDCDACMESGFGILPGIVGQDIVVREAGFTQSRVIVVGGILDFNTFEFTFSKFGISEFSVDASNACDNPKEVEVPLDYSVGEETAVTIDVAATRPQGLDALTETLGVYLPGHGLGLVSAVMFGMNIGGVEITETSYLFRGLSAAGIAPEPLLDGAQYGVVGGFSAEDGSTESSRRSMAPITDSTQTITIDELLALPTGLKPADGSMVDLDDPLELAWGAVDGAGMYFATITQPFFNGRDQEERLLWQFAAPADVTSLTVPALAQAGLPGLEACRFYRFKPHAFQLTGYDFEEGVYPASKDFFFEFTPCIYSMNSAIFFTQGESCGPLISRISDGELKKMANGTLYGMHFGSEQGTSAVIFDDAAVDIVTWSNDTIAFTAPNVDGSYKVFVTVEGVDSNPAYIEVRD